MRIIQPVSSSKLLGFLKLSETVPALLDLSGESPAPIYDIIKTDIITLRQQIFAADLDVFSDLATFYEVTGVEIKPTISSDATPVPTTDSIFDRVRNLFSTKPQSHFTNPFHSEAVKVAYAHFREEIHRHRAALKRLDDIQKDCLRLEKQVAGVRSKLFKPNLTFAKKTQLESSLNKKLVLCEFIKNQFYETYLTETLIRDTLKQMSDKMKLEALCKLEMSVAKLMKIYGHDIDTVDLEGCARAIYDRYSVKLELAAPSYKDVELVLGTCCSKWV